MLLGILFTFVIATAAVYKTVRSAFENAQGKSNPVKVSVISEAEAKKLFGSFVANPEIPFRYPVDGCYARATAMAQMAEKEKIEMAKVYAEGLLIAKTDYEEMPEVMWGWHVAPVVYVKKRSGRTEMQVFDPSLFKEPVSVDVWKKRMLEGAGAKVKTVYYGSKYQYYAKHNEREQGQWLTENLDDVKRTFQTYLPFQYRGRDQSGTSTTLQQGAR